MLDRGDQDALTCALRDSLYYATVYESYNLCYGVVYGRGKQPGTGVSLACAGYLFLGSRLGNSLLLRFASREVGQARRGEREPPSKRLDMQGDWPVTEPEMDADFK